MSMKHIESVHDLLFSVARSGDPSAFYALFENQIEAVIGHILHEEQNINSVSSRVSQGVEAIYCRFFRSSINQSVHQWFEKQIQDEFGISTDPDYEQPLTAEQLNVCTAHLMAVLQRRHHALFSKKRSKAGKGILGNVQHRKILVFGGGVIALFFVAGILLFKQTNSTLSVRLQSPKKLVVFSIPFNSDSEAKPADSIVSAETVQDTVDTVTVVDSVDTVATAPVKKQTETIRKQTRKPRTYTSSQRVGNTAQSGKTTTEEKPRLSSVSKTAKRAVSESAAGKTSEVSSDRASASIPVSRARIESGATEESSVSDTSPSISEVIQKPVPSISDDTPHDSLEKSIAPEKSESDNSPEDISSDAAAMPSTEDSVQTSRQSQMDTEPTAE
ncbi:MAG: hypothetical protein ACOC4C_00465 [Fibrobacterota bacterium]